MRKNLINFNISFDPEAGAMYVKLRDNKIKKTIEVEPETFIDIDYNDNLVGVEFLNPCSINVGLEQIIRAFNLPSQSIKFPKLTKAFESFAEALPSKS